LGFMRPCLSVHFFVRFEPPAGKEKDFREELLRVVAPTRAETGCLAMHVFESLREPLVFAIHSEWADEAAFERHAQLPHTIRFIGAAEELLGRPVQGLRSREIAGGAGKANTSGFAGQQVVASGSGDDPHHGKSECECNCPEGSVS
jgi:quinol monooxygenase YgiN